MQIIYCPSYTAGVAQVFAGLGSQVFLGGKKETCMDENRTNKQTRIGGHLVTYNAVLSFPHPSYLSTGGSLYFANNTIPSAFVVSAFLGAGSAVWIGGGIGVFRRNQLHDKTKFSYSTTNYTYTVGCMGVNSSDAKMAIKVKV